MWLHRETNEKLSFYCFSPRWITTTFSTKLLSRGCELTTILSLTRYTLTSVCIFSILCSIYFLRCWQGEFVWQSRASLVGGHFVYSCDFNVWFRGDIVGRNRTLVTHLIQDLKKLMKSPFCYLLDILTLESYFCFFLVPMIKQWTFSAENMV